MKNIMFVVRDITLLTLRQSLKCAMNNEILGYRDWVVFLITKNRTKVHKRIGWIFDPSAVPQFP